MRELPPHLARGAVLLDGAVPRSVTPGEVSELMRDLRGAWAPMRGELTERGIPTAYQAQYADFKAVNIPAVQTTTSTTYTTLTTPDQVTVYLPADGLLEVWYHALWQDTVTVNGRAALFIGANQLKTNPTSGSGGAPSVQEAISNTNINTDSVLATNGWGLNTANATPSVTEVTTGESITPSSVAGGPISVFAAAGTYVISIQFKNSAAGTLTASKRHLWVRVNEPTARA